eukprot:gene6467-6695_t
MHILVQLKLIGPCHQALSDFPEQQQQQVVPVGVVWFAAQLSFTISLAHTSVTSNTILSSSSSMFTLLASALVLKERVTAVKVISVAAVMTGTALVTLSDASADDGSQSLLGDALCVVSAVLYSCYTIIMQQQLGADDVEAPALLFGYIGVLTALMGLPVVLTLHWWGVWDLMELHPQALLLAVLNGLMDYVCADYTWVRAVLLLGSTVATLGMSLQIPLATAGDLLLRRHPHWLDSQQSVLMTCGGTVAILAGILGVNLASSLRRGQVAEDVGSSTVAVQEPLLGQADALDNNA